MSIRNVFAALMTLALLASSPGCRKHRSRSRQGPGKPCGRRMWCKRKLTCFKHKCVTYAEMRRLKEIDQRRQSGLPPLAGSGTGSAPGSARARFAEHQTRPGAIVVRTAKARYSAWASCAADERLISGGCSADKLNTSRPVGYQKGDTIGARWRCAATSSRVTAYALCAKLPPTKAAPRAPAPSADKPSAGKPSADKPSGAAPAKADKKAR